jgi:MoxR-like ATPase
MSSANPSASATGAEAGLPATLARIKAAREALLGELQKAVIGQRTPMEQLLTAMFARGHCLIQGPLASAKTILVASVARVMDLQFKRIQFTPDLMPADISGTEILEEDTSGHRVMKFVRGPVFANVLMADEINRTPPKTQAALLEVMQEHQVTLGGTTHPLPEPFFVLATQVTIEQEGTYPLPEAQQDRFMFSLRMEDLPEDEEVAVVRQSTGAARAELRKVIGGADLIAFNAAIRQVTLPPALGQYIADLVGASRPSDAAAPDFVKDYIVWGAGLRASQNIALGAKSLAAQEARDTVRIEDIRRVIYPVLRHRIGMSFRAEVDGVSIDDIIKRLIEAVPAPAAAKAA